jgi:hypothetical protein
MICKYEGYVRPTLYQAVSMIFTFHSELANRSYHIYTR